MPHWRSDPNLIPPAIIPTPATIPGRAHQHANAERNSSGRRITEYDPWIVDRHVNPFRIGGQH
jgi:hypothetical protein